MSSVQKRRLQRMLYKRKIAPYVRKLEQTPHLNLKSEDIYDILRTDTDLESKYLNLMRLPITGKDRIEIPYDLSSHHQHNCLEFSMYANEQVFKSVCSKCENYTIPTASDAAVAFMTQVANIMQHRTYFYGFRKQLDLVKIAAKQPVIFQIFFILSRTIQEVFPIMYKTDDMLHMMVIFEKSDIHFPCDAIKQIIDASPGYNVVLDMINEHLVMNVRCKAALESTTIQVDINILGRKFEELDVPDVVNEKHEKYKQRFGLPI